MAINSKYIHSEISNVVLQAFYTVRSSLLYDLDIEIYSRALKIEMELLGLDIEMNKELKIKFKNKHVGSLFIDFVVNNSIVLKTINADNISEQDEADVKNQLRMSEYEVGLILNFAAEEQHKRIVFTNDLKNKLSK